MEKEWEAALRREIAGRDFDDLDDLQDLVEAFFRRRNRTPRDDFHGLSPEEMHLMLDFPFDSPQIVEFADRLSDPPDAPFARVFEMLAESVETGKLKPTAKGNLPRRVCQDIADALWNRDNFPYERYFFNVNREDDFVDLHVVRIVAQMAGFLRKYRGHFILGRECRALRQEAGMAGVYPPLLKTFIRSFNWAYRDGYPEIPFLQQSFLFTLFLLTKHGGEWRSARFYADLFLLAFPLVLEDIVEVSYSPRKETLQTAFTLRVLIHFAAFAGLAEVEDLTNRGGPPQYRVRGTRLLREAVRFNL